MGVSCGCFLLLSLWSVLCSLLGGWLRGRRLARAGCAVLAAGGRLVCGAGVAGVVAPVGLSCSSRRLLRGALLARRPAVRRVALPVLGSGRRPSPAPPVAGRGVSVFAVSSRRFARGCAVVAFSPRSAAFVAFSWGPCRRCWSAPVALGAAWVLVAGFESLASASSFARRAAIRSGRSVAVRPGAGGAAGEWSVSCPVAWPSSRGPARRGSPAACGGWGPRPVRHWARWLAALAAAGRGGVAVGVSAVTCSSACFPRCASCPPSSPAGTPVPLVRCALVAALVCAVPAVRCAQPGARQHLTRRGRASGAPGAGLVPPPRRPGCAGRPPPLPLRYSRPSSSPGPHLEPPPPLIQIIAPLALMVIQCQLIVH